MHTVSLMKISLVGEAKPHGRDERAGASWRFLFRKIRGKVRCERQIPGVRWPGYDGFYRAISNDWNRTRPWKMQEDVWMPLHD